MKTDFNLRLQNMLKARDDRANKQRQLIEKFHIPLISYTLNIPGIVKRTPTIDLFFDLSMTYITKTCLSNEIGILHQEKLYKDTGNEGYITVNADAKVIKDLMIKIETLFSFARLMDIDVFDRNNQQITRSSLGYPERNCICCQEMAKICIKNNTHSLEEISTQVETLINKGIYILYK